MGYAAYFTRNNTEHADKKNVVSSALSILSTLKKEKTLRKLITLNKECELLIFSHSNCQQFKSMRLADNRDDGGVSECEVKISIGYMLEMKYKEGRKCFI